MMAALAITSHNGVPTVRDTDLAVRAGLSQPRDIRRTVMKCMSDGLIRIIGGAAPDDLTALDSVGFEFTEPVLVGKGATRQVTSFLLSEAAATHVLMALRTPRALELRREVVEVFVRYRHGLLGQPQVSRQEFAVLAGVVEQLGQVVAKVLSHVQDAPGRAQPLQTPSGLLRNDIVLWEHLAEAIRNCGALWAQARSYRTRGGKLATTGTPAVKSRLRRALGIQSMDAMTVGQLSAALACLRRLSREAQDLIDEAGISGAIQRMLDGAVEDDEPEPQPH